MMKGIVKVGPVPGATWREDLPQPRPGEGEILVRVKAAAICGTDLHIYNWTPWAEKRIKPPMVFGHEFSGEVVEVGPGVKRVKPGDVVAGETHIGCGICRQCNTGNVHICEQMKIIGVHTSGCFAEYIAVPEGCAWVLDKSMSFEHGALLEPMGVAMHGVEAAVVGGKDVLVLGCGPIGLMGVGICRVFGADKIIASEPFMRKLELAVTMGATLTVQAGKEDVVAVVKNATSGRGVDVVIDYSGNEQAINDGLAALAKGGRMVLVGLPDRRISLDLVDGIIYKEATVIGVTGRTMYGTWYECRRVLDSGRFELEPVIGGRYPLKEFDKAFALLMGGAPGKMLLIP